MSGGERMRAHGVPGPAPAGDDCPPPSHDTPLPVGDRNQNPPGIRLWALLAEDYRTHDRHLREPGFLAIAIHRFGNARMSIRSRLLRAPLSLLYHALYRWAALRLGIDIVYTVRLGRRVRLWHHGGMILGARAIGDDVHIRQNTTFGIPNRVDLGAKPIIGNRVDIGPGACVLGAVTVGDDCVVGPNSVVLRSFPPGTTVMGVPARQVSLAAEGSGPKKVPG